MDLSNAGAADKIVFYVKQNYKGGVYLNIQTAGGHLYRSTKLTPGKWTRVEFDLDVTKWTGKAKAWGPATAFSFYHRAFDKPEEYMMLDGFSITLGGQSLAVDTTALADPAPAWAFPCETKEAWFLGNADTAWGVSKTTGQVVGGWNVKRRERCLKLGRNRYHVEDLKSLHSASEDDDVIQEPAFDKSAQTLTLLCANPTMPGLRGQEKNTAWTDSACSRRRPSPGRTGPDKFITYNSEAALMPDYRKGGFYVGAGFVGPIVPAPNLTSWQKVTVYKTTTKGMLLHQPAPRITPSPMCAAGWTAISPGRGSPAPSAGHVEEKNKLNYTPDGWDISLGTSPMKADWRTSFEEYYRVVPGNWFTWLAETYPSQPEVQSEAARIPDAPDWVGDVRAMLSFGRGGLARIRRVVESSEEGSVMVLVGLLGQLERTTT